jgi:hypothetical protein
LGIVILTDVEPASGGARKTPMLARGRHVEHWIRMCIFGDSIDEEWCLFDEVQYTILQSCVKTRKKDGRGKKRKGRDQYSPADPADMGLFFHSLSKWP